MPPDALALIRRAKAEKSKPTAAPPPALPCPTFSSTPPLPPPLSTTPSPSITVVRNFISPEDEELLLANIAAAPPDRWTGGRPGRRTANWGGRPGESFVRETLPPWIASLVDAITRSGAWPVDVVGGPPNHCLINEYEAGAGLTPHTDGVMYAPHVCTLSLGSDVVLDLHKPTATEDADANALPLASLLLRRRSLNVYAGPAYSELFHGIAPRVEDVLRETVVNLEAEDSLGEVIKRRRRWSVVFVHKLQAPRASEPADQRQHSSTPRDEEAVPRAAPQAASQSSPPTFIESNFSVKAEYEAWLGEQQQAA